MKNTKIQPLYERVQFVENTENQKAYNYNFVGSNYDSSLSKKEITAICRKHIKERFPEVKFSITCKNYNSINCYIVSSPYDNKKLEYDPELESSAYKEYEREHNKELLAIIDYTEKYIESYNFDDSDGMSDYFHRNFYLSCRADWKYQQTEQTEEIKKVIEDYRLQLKKEEEQAKIQKELEFQEYLKQEKIRELEYQEILKQETINRQIVNSNASYKDISDNEQYMIRNIKMANLNKNNTYDEYLKKIEEGAYYLQDMKVTRELHFKTSESLELFKNMFLTDFNFISGTGGDYPDDVRITSYTDYERMTTEERKTVKLNMLGIAVYCNDALQFVIDAQGFNYARYIGITDDAIIAKIETTNPIKSELKILADRIEEISLDIIYNNEIEDYKDSIDYQGLLLQNLKRNDIVLSKELIRLIETEDLKIYLYELFDYLNSIQLQFKNANIQQGKKITVIDMENMLGIVYAREAVFNGYLEEYDGSVKMCLRFKNKKISENYYCNDSKKFIIVSGWVSTTVKNLLATTTKNDFTTIRVSNSLSCDKQALKDIKDYLVQNNYKLLIDTVA